MRKSVRRSGISLKCKFVLLLLLVSNVCIVGISAQPARLLSSAPPPPSKQDQVVQPFMSDDKPYRVNDDGTITMTHKRRSEDVEMKLVVPSKTGISFTAIRPYCNDGVRFSYKSGCSNRLEWGPENFYLGDGDSNEKSSARKTINIFDGKTDEQYSIRKEERHRSVYLCDTDFRDNNESEQGGYLVDFSMRGDHECDISIEFDSSYKEFIEPVPTTPAPAEEVKTSLWIVVGIPVGIVILLLMLMGSSAGGYYFWKRKNRQTPLPTTFQEPTLATTDPKKQLDFDLVTKSGKRVDKPKPKKPKVKPAPPEPKPTKVQSADAKIVKQTAKPNDAKVPKPADLDRYIYSEDESYDKAQIIDAKVPKRRLRSFEVGSLYPTSRTIESYEKEDQRQKEERRQTKAIDEGDDKYKAQMQKKLDKIENKRRDRSRKALKAVDEKLRTEEWEQARAEEHKRQKKLEEMRRQDRSREALKAVCRSELSTEEMEQKRKRAEEEKKPKKRAFVMQTAESFSKPSSNDESRDIQVPRKSQPKKEDGSQSKGTGNSSLNEDSTTISAYQP